MESMMLHAHIVTIHYDRTYENEKDDGNENTSVAELWRTQEVLLYWLNS